MCPISSIFHEIGSRADRCPVFRFNQSTLPVGRVRQSLARRAGIGAATGAGAATTAASPQPAAVLHAGPASPSPPPPEATRPVAVEVGSAGGQRTAPASLSRAELHALSKSALVERVVELQRELGAWNEL